MMLTFKRWVSGAQFLLQYQVSLVPLPKALMKLF
jgi:hypothetical protein